MKTLKIGTKSQADRLLVDSLFNVGGTLTPERYDLGHYKADVSYVGRECEVHDSVFALWVEKRRDSDGPYAALFCLSKIPARSTLNA